MCRKRVVVLVSREDHCLADLLHRWRSGDLDCDIPCVISNHADLRALVEWHGIDFLHVPVAAGNKAAAFAEVGCSVRRRRARRDGAGPLHADPPAPMSAPATRTDHQHPPQLPAVVRRRPALSPGVRTGREAHRGHLSLRDRRPRRRADHRAGHQPDRPRRHGRGSAPHRAGHRAVRAGPGAALAPRGPGAPERQPDRRLRLGCRPTSWRQTGPLTLSSRVPRGQADRGVATPRGLRSGDGRIHGEHGFGAGRRRGREPSGSRPRGAQLSQYRRIGGGRLVRRLAGTECPLDAQSIDVAVGVGPAPDLDRLGDGEVCAIRRRIPLVLLDRPDDPLRRWAAAQTSASQADEVIHQVRAAILPEHTAEARRIVRDWLQRHQLDATAVGVEVRRRQATLLVELWADARLTERDAEGLGVYLAQCVRRFDPWAKGIDVSVHGAIGATGR